MIPMANHNFEGRRHMFLSKAVICLLGMTIILCPVRSFAESLAVIVHSDNPTEDISFEDLGKIFKAEKSHWLHDGKIYILMHEASSKEQQMILRILYGMTAKDLKKFWLMKIYQGEISSFPKTVASNESLRRFVEQVPNAIGIIPSQDAGEDVKVLKVDGKLPGEDGYKLM